MLRERWISVLFHIQDKHRSTGHKKFQKCVHPHLTKNQVKAKEWLSPAPKAFEALQNIILDKKVLEDLSYLTKFCHMRVLEIFNSLHNKWAPKRQHFLYLGMLARSQLAIMILTREVIWKKLRLKKMKRDITCNFPKLSKAGLRNQSK